ncbi:MAG: tRNA uridine(34) 5-carboxymethylaminomethyl modification radical SAM/GNAT enzyme Elp3 [Nanoarchaeota archaeon]
MEFYREIIDYIKKEKPDKKKLSKKKLELCKKHKLQNIPTDIEVLLHTSFDELSEIKELIITKPGRTGSGVAVVAIMTYPFKCPHGECAMCPSYTDDNVPQSYTGKEPATLRGIRNEFDPYLQVMNRLEQYIVTGHSPEKVELIIMGGTFMSFPKEYKRDFVYYAYKAMNDFSKMFNDCGELNIEKFKEFFELPGDIQDKERAKKIEQKLLKLKEHNSNPTFAEEKKQNESSTIRCVGLTIETRPDYGKLKEGNEMLEYGCTRVELGVQTVYDDVLEGIERGHSVQDSIESTQILKDLGFKINYHVMPGLPNVSFEKDIEGFKKLFENENFRPDMLKIYPCMVLKNTKLYKRWKKGEFRPLDAENASRLIREFKKYVPRYVRIMRVQRDIPTYAIEAGVERTNLRQMIDQHEHNCKCIRCREAGRVFEKKGRVPEKPKTHIKKYNASGGTEYFISIEEDDVLFGFIRLRFPGKALRDEITKNSAFVRELHVYGGLARIGKEGKYQHKGHGKKLLQKAEEIAKENDKYKIIVISGVGVRDYYCKQGYELEGPYMVKYLL